MFYNIMLYGSLAVFVVGLIYKISKWFRLSIGFNLGDITTTNRVASAVKGTLGTLFSNKVVNLVQTLFRDVLLQLHIFKEDRLRWAMHMLIFAGFMFLLIFHAFDRVLIHSLFEDYYRALNPWLIVSGLIVLAGLGVALARRYVMKVSRLKTDRADLFAIILITIILISGLIMEIFKLTSFNHYQKFWYIHIAACFIGLGYLPFSKMFHMITTPLSLLVNSVMDENSDPANIATRRALELDACTRCTTCSKQCSVAVAYDQIGNSNILPSERMGFLKDYIVDKNMSAKKMQAIQDGIYFCTNCDRCTVGCPAGINLRDLWFSVREEVISKKHKVSLMMSPFSYFRGLNRKKIDQQSYDGALDTIQDCLTQSFTAADDADTPILLSDKNREFSESIGLRSNSESYAKCFACENCSTVCPVVTNYEHSQAELGLLPHQIIRSAVLGLQDLALGSKMLWNCLTCYQCQEHCPQGVKVTDVFYALKNMSAGKQAETCT